MPGKVPPFHSPHSELRGQFPPFQGERVFSAPVTQGRGLVRGVYYKHQRLHDAFQSIGASPQQAYQSDSSGLRRGSTLPGAQSRAALRRVCLARSWASQQHRATGMTALAPPPMIWVGSQNGCPPERDASLQTTANCLNCI